VKAIVVPILVEVYGVVSQTRFAEMGSVSHVTSPAARNVVGQTKPAVALGGVVHQARFVRMRSASCVLHVANLPKPPRLIPSAVHRIRSPVVRSAVHLTKSVRMRSVSPVQKGELPAGIVAVLRV
jgi:hypothetical protein